MGNSLRNHPVEILNKLVAKPRKPRVAKRILYFYQSKSLYDGLRTYLRSVLSFIQYLLTSGL